MKVPIQYALTYPQRRQTPTERLDLTQAGTLTFEPPDLERFPCLQLAYDAAQIGGTMPAVMSGADEVAVQTFLERRIRFDEIPRLIAATMARHAVHMQPSLHELLEADAWARATAWTLVETGAIPAMLGSLVGSRHV
jgi:1-deoxy-D-xylulose-5-phosphate reductoisomerase